MSVLKGKGADTQSMWRHEVGRGVLWVINRLGAVLPEAHLYFTI